MQLLRVACRHRNNNQREWYNGLAFCCGLAESGRLIVECFATLV
jgi:hypothetical protein